VDFSVSALDFQDERITLINRQNRKEKT
jgi:hypothetical protein